MIRLWGRVVGSMIRLSTTKILMYIVSYRKGRTMAKLTPVQAAEKHARRLSGATADIQAGIDRIQVNPCEQAAAKKEKMLANLTKAVNDGKWEAGLKRVTLDQWKKKARDVGVPRIAAGIAAARDKMVSFYSELLPHIDAGQAKLATMSDLTLEDNIARMNEMTRHMATFKRTK